MSEVKERNRDEVFVIVACSGENHIILCWWGDFLDWCFSHESFDTLDDLPIDDYPDLPEEDVWVLDGKVKSRSFPVPGSFIDEVEYDLVGEWRPPRPEEFKLFIKDEQ